jgi:hypothetical protein
MERLDGQLLLNIQRRLHAFKDLQTKIEDHWGAEDGVYRFYHQSFKVYRLQAFTEEVVNLLESVDPKPKKAGKHDLHPFFREIIAAGTGIEFHPDHNSSWTRHTRPIVEAFFHARYVLDMVIKYSPLEEAPRMLPSGWAGVLSVFRMR